MQFKIVYLDDEEALCQIFEDNFDWPELSVKTFVDAEAAIQEIAEHSADLMFIDYRLKGTTADQVSKRLPANLPLVLLTGELNPMPETQFLRIFNKPFRLKELEQFLNDAIREKASSSNIQK